MIASVLENAGYKVGLFTSPHIKTINENIRINFEPIDFYEMMRIEAEVIDYYSGTLLTLPSNISVKDDYDNISPCTYFSSIRHGVPI